MPPAVKSLRPDANLRDATLYRLQTLAESASLVSDAVKARHPEIPFAGIAGFRNRLAHGYADVNLDRVWEVIERDLGPLREAVRAELGRDLSRGRERDTGPDIGF